MKRNGNNMKLKYNGRLMAKYLKEKRVVDKANKISISLGQASKQVGVSKPTLSRLEKGSAPDIITFAIVCNWIDKPMSLFFDKKSK